MKITSLNVNRFRGCYKKNKARTVEIRSSHMERVKKFIQDYDLLTEPNDIVLLQEASYRESNDYYDLFRETFSDYEIIEPDFVLQLEPMAEVVAFTTKKSNWTKAAISHFNFKGDYTYEMKVLELENLSIHQSLINLHMPIVESLWNSLFISLKDYRYTYVVGDLNAHENEHYKENNMSNRLEELRYMDYIDLVPPDYITYFKGQTSIDHFFIDSFNEGLDLKEIEFEVLGTTISDHASLIYEIKTDRTNSKG